MCIVGTNFDLNPEQEWTQAQKTQTINLQRVGEKASLNLGLRYWYIALKGKSYTSTHAKSILGHVLVLGLTVMNFSFLLLYFFNLLLSLSLSFLQSFFSVPLSSNLFLYYILWFLHHFLHSRVGQVLGVLFLCSPLPLLEPSTLSCKAACSLFRYHLHINAARELAGQHLMRGNSTSIYLFFLILILYLIFSHPLCCKVLPKRYLKGLRSLLATSDRGSEVVIILGYG